MSVQQYLYRIQPARTAMLHDGGTPEEDAAVARHSDYLKRLADQGTVLLAGRTLNTGEACFGIAIFTASSEAEARRVVGNDPAVKAGVFRAQLFPYRIALIGAAFPTGNETGVAGQ
jgi:uncharacterized protein YciI